MFVRRSNSKSMTSRDRRSGVVLVENAIMASVFGLFLTGIMEFGHTYMVQGAMNAAVQRAARYGAVDGVSSQEVRALANQVLSSAFKSAKATVTVKNAGVFDTSGVDARTINYANLPDLELLTAPTHQMYIVRITVPYNSVALLPPFWVKNVTLKAQSVMRHE